MGIKKVLLACAAALLFYGCAHQPRKDNNLHRTESNLERIVNTRTSARLEQAAYILPSAVFAVIQHEASHGIVAKIAGAEYVRFKLYPHKTLNENDGFSFYFAAVYHPQFTGRCADKKSAAVSMAGPASYLIAGEGIKLFLKQGLAGKDTEPFFAAAALANDIALYHQLLWAPFATDMTDASKDLHINPLIWLGVGLAKAGYDIFISHDTENLVKTILGKRTYAKKEESTIEPIFLADRETVGIGLGFKF